jgi:hypothetical protein
VGFNKCPEGPRFGSREAQGGSSKKLCRALVIWNSLAFNKRPEGLHNWSKVKVFRPIVECSRTAFVSNKCPEGPLLSQEKRLPRSLVEHRHRESERETGCGREGGREGERKK